MNKGSYTDKNNKFFYTVLTLSVLAVIAAAVGVTFTVKNIRSAQNEPTQTQIDWDNHPATVDDAQAEKIATDIKDERTTDEDEKPSEDEESEAQSEITTEKTTAAAAQEKAIECSLPLGTSILKDYSNGTMVKSKTMNDWRTHNGVDFTGEIGDEIRAVCAGKVTQVGSDPSWGNTVTVEHENGVTAIYCGIDGIEVEEGMQIARDDVIGTLGVIPIESADASHLHFETLKDGKYVDPIEALSLQREEE